MDELLKNQFKKRIELRKSSSFQNFCRELFLKKFGQNFQPIKDKQDRGCDGILNKNTILSIYSPEKENLRSFKSKVKDDYQKYKDNWKSKYKKWCFVYNGELTADRIKFLDEISKNCLRWDINYIIEIIDSLPYHKMNQLAKDLNIDENLIVYDVLKIVIEDLSKDLDITIRKEKIPSLFKEKVRVNYSQREQEDALKEYRENLTHILKLEEVLKHFEDKHISSLKNKVKIAYDMLKGNFKQRINNLVKSLSTSRENDDLYVFYVRIIVIYFFERCVIGKNPGGNNNDNTST